MVIPSVEFGRHGEVAPSVECRWDGGRMTFTLVRSEPALVEGLHRYEVEASWEVRGVESLRRLRVTSANGGAALETCARHLARVVGGLTTQWGMGPEI